MVDTASNDRITVDLQIKTQKYAIAITLSVTKQNKLLSYSIQKKKNKGTMMQTANHGRSVQQLALTRASRPRWILLRGPPTPNPK